MRGIQEYLQIYLKNKPMFLGMIRAKELELFERFLKRKRSLGDMKRKAFHKAVSKESLRVLDFGCGDGFFMSTSRLTQMLSRKMRIVGLEVDEKIAEQARKTKVYKEVVVYDGEKIPFVDEYFDIVMSNCVLEHVSNTKTRKHKNTKTQNQSLKLVINEIYRVLKPGGKFYTTVMTDKWEEYLFGSLFFGNLYKKWMRKIQKHFNLLSAKEWQATFENAGFSVEEVVGYMDKRASRWMDFLHYISVGSLIFYKLFGRWVFFPRQYDFIPAADWITPIIRDDISLNKSAAAFFVLEK